MRQLRRWGIADVGEGKGAVAEKVEGEQGKERRGEGESNEQKIFRKNLANNIENDCGKMLNFAVAFAQGASANPPEIRSDVKAKRLRSYNRSGSGAGNVGRCEGIKAEKSS